MSFDPEVPLPGAPDPWAGSTMPAVRSGPPYAMTEMIAAEPAVAERLARRLASDPALSSLRDAIHESTAAQQPIVVTGCGTSEHAAEGIAAMLRLTADARHAQALELLALPPVTGLVIGISHEGGTRFTNEALRASRSAGARTALVTVSDRSPGAALVEIVVTTGEQDASWCHTVGYLSPLVVGAALSGSSLDATALRAVLQVADDAPGAEAVAGALARCDRLVTVGSGADHVTARELALKVAEGAHLPAQALHLETLLHGHLAAAGPTTGLVLVLTGVDPMILDRARDVLRAAAALGMPAAAVLGADVGDEIPRDLTAAGRLAVPETPLLEAVSAGLLAAAIPIQLLAERLARARGVNPDTLGREDPAQAAAHV
jgi:glucosamine--fructose-6-phosphate aminotransferase (isomerizing)